MCVCKCVLKPKCYKTILTLTICGEQQFLVYFYDEKKATQNKKIGLTHDPSGELLPHNLKSTIIMESLLNLFIG